MKSLFGRRCRHSRRHNAKSGLNDAISDAAWYQLRQKIAYQSQKQGKKHTVVAAHHTSQECSECHYISADNRDGEKFICSECGYFDDSATSGYRSHCISTMNTLYTMSRPCPKPKLKLFTNDYSL